MFTTCEIVLICVATLLCPILGLSAIILAGARVIIIIVIIIIIIITYLLLKHLFSVRRLTALLLKATKVCLSVCPW